MAVDVIFGVLVVIQVALILVNVFNKFEVESDSFQLGGVELFIKGAVSLAALVFQVLILAITILVYFLIK